jgi:hypothetical protein
MIWINGTVTLLNEDESEKDKTEAQARDNGWNPAGTGLRKDPGAHDLSPGALVRSARSILFRAARLVQLRA